MTTGRINQVAFTYPRQITKKQVTFKQPAAAPPAEPKPSRVCRTAGHSSDSIIKAKTQIIAHHPLAKVAHVILSPQRSFSCQHKPNQLGRSPEPGRFGLSGRKCPTHWTGRSHGEPRIPSVPVSGGGLNTKLAQCVSINQLTHITTMRRIPRRRIELR